MTEPRRAAPIHAALLALALAACAATGSEERSIGWLVAHGRYGDAVRLAAERHAANPGDPAAERDWRRASVAYHLERGRRLYFDDRDTEALEQFRAAQAIDGEAEPVRAWIETTLDKIADDWATKGAASHAADDLVEASNCYEKALEYRPEHALALQGLGRVLVQMNHRLGMSGAYYDEGLAALEGFLLDQAAHDFEATLKYESSNERAARRRDQTNTLRAEVRVALAAQLEEAARYAAARNEYRFALLFDANHAEAQAGFERMKVEAHAAELLREAERRILRKDFDLAQQAIDEGAAITARQAAEFADANARLLHARFLVVYESVRRMEADYRYEEAIAAYGALLEAHPQHHFEDAIARRDILVETVARARDLHARALATEDLGERLTLLRQVEVLWPEYDNIAARIAELEAALASEAADEGATPPRR
jgi:tetratricopeptide (TPR) repeat protein